MAKERYNRRKCLCKCIGAIAFSYDGALDVKITYINEGSWATSAVPTKFYTTNGLWNNIIFGKMFNFDSHLHWNKCPKELRNLYKGKESYPTLGFNVAVYHFHYIHHASNFYYGTVERY